MRKLKKLVVTVAALAALAVGGAAFAQAQNASTPVTPTHQSIGEETSPGDTDTATGQAEVPDSASKADVPEGPNDPADQGSQED
ncbi:MAG TPA: hypothetical protein VNS60_11615 [Solirubrobacterales bacterium]|nr:hypothetical protein [Solirubrobacterales bacterium]